VASAVEAAHFQQPLEQAIPPPDLPAGDDLVTLELALFAALFPMGEGHFREGEFTEYLRYRTSCLFSVFTLHKPYLLLMYQIRQCLLLAKQVSEVVLEEEMAKYQAKHPAASSTVGCVCGVTCTSHNTF
jgi:hypothetical protein